MNVDLEHIALDEPSRYMEFSMVSTINPILELYLSRQRSLRLEGYLKAAWN